MGVLYSRVNGAWVPITASAPPAIGAVRTGLAVQLSASAYTNWTWSNTPTLSGMTATSQQFLRVETPGVYMASFTANISVVSSGSYASAYLGGERYDHVSPGNGAFMITAMRYLVAGDMVYITIWNAQALIAVNASLGRLEVWKVA